MKVYLADAVQRLLAAHKLMLTSSNPDGMLLGHKRADLFFVENIFPSPTGFFPSPQKYFSLSKILDHQILGFYSFETDENKLKKILCPLAYGKVFLQLELDKNGQMEMKPFIIDYEKDFFLSPLELDSKP
jgi:hypothetical protein